MTSSDPQPAIRLVEARTHGRFVVRVPRGAGPWPLVVGFHGYRENATTHLDALSSIPGIDDWLVVSVQALHPFYTRDQQVVASWMTREDREMAIADNVDYVGRVLNDVRREWPVTRPLVFAGFSQGGAMAYRAAAAHACDAIVVLAADVPPDVAQSSTPLPRVLLGRGTADAWYTAAKGEADLRTLSGRARRVEECVFEGGHDWSEPFTAAAGRLLDELKSEV
jgi:poly(3-hydroxybutyrate) depolymerase